MRIRWPCSTDLDAPCIAGLNQTIMITSLTVVIAALAVGFELMAIVLDRIP